MELELPGTMLQLLPIVGFLGENILQGSETESSLRRGVDFGVCAALVNGERREGVSETSRNPTNLKPECTLSFSVSENCELESMPLTEVCTFAKLEVGAHSTRQYS